MTTLRFKCRLERCLSVFEASGLGGNCPNCGAVPEETYGETEEIVKFFSQITGISDPIEAVTKVLQDDLQLAFSLQAYHVTMAGWICPRDRHVLEQITLSYQETSTLIVELGVAQGGCTNMFLTARKDASYIGIDNWEHSKEEDFWDNCRHYKNRIRLITGDTRDVGKEWSDHPTDILLIDANHSYDFVKSDITNFVPQVKVNGIIACDDYHCSTVKRAVDELLVSNPQYQLVRKPDPKYGMAEKLIVFKKVSC